MANRCVHAQQFAVRAEEEATARRSKHFGLHRGQTDCFARGRLMQTKTSTSRSGAIDLEKSPAEVLTLPFDGEGKPEPASKSKNKKAVAGFRVG